MHRSALAYLMLVLGLTAYYPIGLSEEKANSLFPLVFFTRDTGLGLGAFWVKNLDAPAEGDPSQVIGLLSYTVKKQSFALLEPKLLSDDGRWEYGGRLFAQDYPNRYFGREGLELDPPEYYKERKGSVALRVKYKWDSLVFAETEAEYQQQTFALEGEDNPQLAKEFAAWGTKQEQRALTFALGYDSRSSRIRPTHGTLLRLGQKWSFWQTERRTSTSELHTLELRKYLSFDAQKSLALQGVIAEIDPQDLVFYQLIGLGGQQLLRGYAANQFRDYAAGLVQAEYRQLFSERWGFHSFIGVGSLATHVRELELDKTKKSGGLGIDYIVEPRSKQNFRLDFGLGENSYGVYLLFGNAI